MATPSIAINRWDLGLTIEEFDLVANQAGYIGPSVLRPIVVAQQSGNIPRVKDNELSSANQSTARAPGANYKRDDFEWDGEGYTCSEFGHEVALDDATLAIYSGLVDAEGIAVRRNTHKILADYEKEVARLMYDASYYTGSFTHALSTPWSDHANSDPIGDIHVAKEASEDYGIDLNCLVCNKTQFWHLLNSAQLLGRMSDVVNKTNTTVGAALMELLDIQMIKIAGGYKNTAIKSQASTTPAYSRIWSDSYAQVCRVATSDDPTEQCIGRTILWTGDGASAAGTDQTLALVTEEYRDDEVRGSVIRSRNWRGMKRWRPQNGHLLSNVVA